MQATTFILPQLAGAVSPLLLGGLMVILGIRRRIKGMTILGSVAIGFGLSGVAIVLISMLFSGGVLKSGPRGIMQQELADRTGITRGFRADGSYGGAYTSGDEEVNLDRFDSVAGFEDVLGDQFQPVPPNVARANLRPPKGMSAGGWPPAPVPGMRGCRCIHTSEADGLTYETWILHDVKNAIVYVASREADPAVTTAPSREGWPNRPTGMLVTRGLPTDGLDVAELCGIETSDPKGPRRVAGGVSPR